MAALTITRGLPGSGKTTYAREWVARDPAKRVRVSRDGLRDMIDNGKFIQDVTEPRIILAECGLIGHFLAEGIDVICDDTNLPEATVDMMRDLAGSSGFLVIDMRGVPLEECIRRNALRDRKVPEEVIRDMHTKYITEE